MKKTLFLGCVALTFSVSAVLAQNGPSQQEQAACRSDAMKYCSSHIGKSAEMNACLKINKSNQSDGCKKVMESRGS